MYYPYLVIGLNIQLDGSQGLLGNSLCMQGPVFSTPETMFHVRKLENTSLVPWTLKGLKDTNLGCPLVHLHLTICHPIRVLAELVPDISIPFSHSMVILDRILDGELEDLKKCLVVTHCSNSNTSDLGFKGNDLYNTVKKETCEIHPKID